MRFSFLREYVISLCYRPAADLLLSHVRMERATSHAIGKGCGYQLRSLWTLQEDIPIGLKAPGWLPA